MASGLVCGLRLCSPMYSVPGVSLKYVHENWPSVLFQKKRRMTGPPAFLHFPACHVLRCILSESKAPPDSDLGKNQSEAHRGAVRVLSVND